MTSRRTLNLTVITALAATAFAGVAMAQDAGNQPPRPGPERGPHRAMALLDTDNDGKVTMEEIVAEHRRLFQAADVNGDGKLSVDEFRRRGHLFQTLHTTTMFDLFDANGDGVLSAEELNAPSQRWFKRYDKNANGALEVEETAGGAPGAPGAPRRPAR